MPIRKVGEIDTPALAVANVVTPTTEPAQKPDSPIEAKPSHENAPNEPNSSVQKISSSQQNDHKEFRIDTPHFEHKSGGVGINGKEPMHPALHRLLTGRKSTLLDLSPIFGK